MAEELSEHYDYGVQILSGDDENKILLGLDAPKKDGEGDNKNPLKSVELNIRVLDEKIAQVSKHFVISLRIRGSIDENLDTTVLKKLLDWSHDIYDENCYRKVIVKIQFNAGKGSRLITLDKMFIVKYREDYLNNEYEVVLNQKDGFIKTITSSAQL